MMNKKPTIVFSVLLLIFCSPLYASDMTMVIPMMFSPFLLIQLILTGLLYPLIISREKKAHYYVFIGFIYVIIFFGTLVGLLCVSYVSSGYSEIAITYLVIFIALTVFSLISAYKAIRVLKG